MIQTQPHGSLSVGQTVKEGIFNTCWSYLGRFEYDYIAPPNVNSSTFNGDYFSSVSVSGVFNDCTSCLTPVVPPVQEKYLYQSCNVISGNVYKTQVVQTIQHPGITTIGQSLKKNGNCFEYLGTVSLDYIIPGNFEPVNFTGDYFAITSPSIFDDVTIYNNCDSCGFIAPITTPTGPGFGRKIICDLLYHQGYLPKEIWEADEMFGRLMLKTNKKGMFGYLTWAKPVVNFLSKNPQYSKYFYLITKPWSEHMAYQMGVLPEDNKLGKVIHYIGNKFSLVVYELITSRKKRRKK